MTCPAHPGGDGAPPSRLDFQVLHAQRVVLDEAAPRFDLVATPGDDHEVGEMERPLTAAGVPAACKARARCRTTAGPPARWRACCNATCSARMRFGTLPDGLEERGRITPSHVIGAVVAPLVAALETPSGRAYLQLLDQILDRPEIPALDVARQLNRSLDRAGRLLAGPMRHLPSAVARARRDLCTAFLLRSPRRSRPGDRRQGAAARPG